MATAYWNSRGCCPLMARAAGFFAVLLVSPPAEAAPSHPNVVILVADDLGWNDVGYHGSEIQTPHIDRLVAEGVELDRFYVWPVCSPTRAGLLTGRSPLRWGITGPLRPNSEGVPEDEHLLPQTFRAAGYQTSIVGKWHLGIGNGQGLPHRRGFDHFYGFLTGFIDYYRHTDAMGGRPDWQRNGEPVEEEGYSTDLLAAEAVRLLRNRDKKMPVLLYVPFNAPHSPLQAPQKLIDKYAAIEDPNRRVYAAMVDALDGAIGRILAVIDAEGMRDDTLVLFFSDNGGAESRGGASNEPLLEGKGSVFEGGIRVPAAMRWPGVLTPGEKIRQIVSVLDVFPTLAAATRVEPGNTKPLDGHDRWAAIRDNKTVAPKDLVIAGGRGCAIFDGPWKLVRIDGGPAREQETYLIRIEDDPTERWDLSAEHPEVVRKLAGQLPAASNPPGPQRRPGNARRRW
ncbi:MAG: arylsulfatase [Planctomycetes bacterium]|nr:arylsulfatase [Planctomycetota bacterium]